MPLWLAHGIDHTAGAFHETLARDTYGCDAPFRRLRVVTRQIFAFALAHRHGVKRADAAVALGIDFLGRHAARPDGSYAWRFDLANRAIDGTSDFYDHAFVLLALAGAAGILPAAPLRARALALLTFLDRDMRHPRAGWIESIPPSLPRRQNPHMHFLEALLAAHEAFGDAIFLARARAVVGLLLDQLLDRETGALPEFFNDRLIPERDDGVFLTEPGHHCEWAALLHRFTRLAGPDPRCGDAAASLLGFANAYGVHPQTGDLIGTVSSDGKHHTRATRLWPQTERLRAAFLPGQPAGLKSGAVASVAAYLLPDGLWHERRDAGGQFLPGASPASSLYHLTTGILAASGGHD